MNPKLALNKTELKKRLLDISYKHGLHHLGSYFSALGIIDDIYSDMADDDIFILSSGHAVVGLYVVLEKFFGFDAEELLSSVGEHPKLLEEKKIYCSTGSLGMGLTVAIGRAIANPNRTVHCLISDGECAEGSIWEALAFITQRKINNLKVYVNANGYCAYDTVDVEFLEKRIKTFNEDVKVVKTSVEAFPFLLGVDAHYKNINQDDYTLACKQLSMEMDKL